MSARSVPASRVKADRLIEEARRAQTPCTARAAARFLKNLAKLECEARQFGAEVSIRFAPADEAAAEKLARQIKAAHLKRWANVRTDVDNGPDSDQVLETLEGVKGQDDLFKKVLAKMDERQLLDQPAVKLAVAAVRAENAAAQGQIVELQEMVERVEDAKNLELEAARRAEDALGARVRAVSVQARLARRELASAQALATGHDRHIARLYRVALHGRRERNSLIEQRDRYRSLWVTADKAKLNLDQRCDALAARVRAISVQARAASRRLASAEALAAGHVQHIARLYRVALGERSEWDKLVEQRDRYYSLWVAADTAKVNLEQSCAALDGAVVGYGDDIQSACRMTAEVTKRRMRRSAPYVIGSALLSPITVPVAVTQWVFDAFSEGGAFRG